MAVLQSYPDMQVCLSGSRSSIPLSEAYRLLSETEHNIRPAGRGSKGRVYSFRLAGDRLSHYALKVTPGNTFACSDIEAGAYSELAMLRYLKHQYIDTGLTPHLQELVEYSCSAKRVCTVSPFAEFGTLHQWTFRDGAAQHESVWRVLLFQLTYTLAWLERVDPLFRHNDLYTKNVLVYADEVENCTRYIAPTRQEFHVPNVGFRAVIADFGMSSIGGMVDNIEAVHHRLNRPAWGIGFDGCASYDLYRIVRETMRGAREAGCLQHFYTLAGDLNKVWNEEMSAGYEWETAPCIRPKRAFEDYPTCAAVLSSELFQRFLRPQPDCTRAYGSRQLRKVDSSQVVEMLCPIDIGTPDRMGQPDFMFNGAKNLEHFRQLVSYRTLFCELFNPDEDSEVDLDCEEEPGLNSSTEEEPTVEQSERAYVQELVERLFFEFDSADNTKKYEELWKIFDSAVKFLEPSGAHNLALLAICIFFFEKPFTNGSLRSLDFLKYAQQQGIKRDEAVQLEYSWLRLKMQELGHWPVPL